VALAPKSGYERVTLAPKSGYERVTLAVIAFALIRGWYGTVSGTCTTLGNLEGSQEDFPSG
jgi:hypothetical protein